MTFDPEEDVVTCGIVCAVTTVLFNALSNELLPEGHQFNSQIGVEPEFSVDPLMSTEEASMPTDQGEDLVTADLHNAVGADGAQVLDREALSNSGVPWQTDDQLITIEIMTFTSGTNQVENSQAQQQSITRFGTSYFYIQQPASVALQPDLVEVYPAMLPPTQKDKKRGCQLAVLILISCLTITSIFILVALKMKRLTALRRDGPPSPNSVHVSPKVEAETPYAYDETLHSVVVGPNGSIQVATKIDE